MKKILFFVVAILELGFSIPTLAVGSEFRQPPEIPQNTTTFQPSLVEGWNLLANPLATPIDLVAVFGSPEKKTPATDAVMSIWVWNSTTSKWGFYSPQMSEEKNKKNTDMKGLDFVKEIEPGEGFWVSAQWSIKLEEQSGVRDNLYKVTALNSGWYLRGISEVITPKKFNNKVGFPSEVPPSKETGLAKENLFASKVKSIWVWNTATSKWAFYAPELEAAGGDVAKVYIEKNQFLDGTDWEINPGEGFWLNWLDKPRTLSYKKD